MKLLDLEPRWIHESVFVFLCPHCVVKGIKPPRLLSCKLVKMSMHDQMELFRNCLYEWTVVPMQEDTCWKVDTRDFGTMTVSPSINANPSGDWHGNITKGSIFGDGIV